MPTESPTRRLYTLPTIWFTGLLLISAGVAKLFSPSTFSVRLPLELVNALSVCEAALGLWLLSGINRVQALLCGILAYISLAAVSGRMATLGIRDCGCMGSIPASPGIICGLDVLSAIGLVIALRHSTNRVTFRQEAFRFLASVAGLTVIAAATGILASQRYGSVEAALHVWQGYTVNMPRAVEAVPNGDDGEALAEIPVQNPTAHTVRIVGAKVCCGTHVLSPMPMTLDPLASAKLVIATTRGQPEAIVTLWVESEGVLKKQRVVVSCPDAD